MVTGNPILSLISLLPGWLGDYSSFLGMSSSSNLWSNDSRYGVVGNMALTAAHQARAVFQRYMPYAPNHSARAFHSGPLALVESAARYHLGDQRVNTVIGAGRGFIRAFNNRGGWRIDLKALGYGIYNYTIGPDSLYGRTIVPLFYNTAGAAGDLIDAGGVISIQSGLPQGRIGVGLRTLARPFQGMRDFYQSTRAAPAAAEAAGVAAVGGRVEVAVGRGVLERANFAQTTYRPAFDPRGLLAGRTVDDVAASLQARRMSVADVPVEYIVRDGNTLILNTRSAQALTQAGIPRSQWVSVNMTGNIEAEFRLTGQLTRNRLTSQGTSTVRPSKGN